MRKWRTLIRVTGVSDNKKYFFAVLPGWNTFKEIMLYMDDLPEDIKPLIVIGKILHAKGYIDVDDEKDLEFEEWEGE